MILNEVMIDDQIMVDKDTIFNKQNFCAQLHTIESFRNVANC